MDSSDLDAASQVIPAPCEDNTASRIDDSTLTSSAEQPRVQASAPGEQSNGVDATSNLRPDAPTDQPETSRRTEIDDSIEEPGSHSEHHNHSEHDSYDERARDSELDQLEAHHIILPADLQAQLDMLSLHYWYECRALICLACDAETQVRTTWLRTMMCKEDVFTHLDSIHSFSSDAQLKALKRCLERLPLLAQNSNQLRDPIPNLEPRPFLIPPINGWACSMCDFVTESLPISKSHSQHRHHATLKRYKRPPHQVRIQHVDGRFFPVRGNPVFDLEKRADAIIEPVSGSSDSKESLSQLLQNVAVFPASLHYWPDCNALVCTACESRPMLCKRSLIVHIKEQHGAEDVFQNLDSLEGRLDEFERLGDEIEDIKIPRPFLGIQAFLQPPVYGWSCSVNSCGYASDNEDVIREHESEAHGDASKQEPRPQVLVQFITLHERVFFSVAHLKGDQPTNTVDDITSYTAELDGFVLRQKARLNSISVLSPDTSMYRPPSTMSEDRRTYRSIFKAKLKDTYTEEERKDILASLWVEPIGDDLEPLQGKALGLKLRELALRDGWEAIRDFRRFDVALFQALLHSQHEIVLLEEEMSHGAFSTGDFERLTRHLINYSSLVKAYKELSVMKQPGQKESREIGRLLATTLHEPRYWYAADALDLIDLRPEDAKESYDVVRTFLQRKAPVGFLDRIGRERREIDAVEAKRVLPSGGMARIIEGHRRHGRYISPAIDNTARILFALLGGIFLLAPMVSLAYTKSKSYLVIITVLFTLFVAVFLGLTSKASNQELLAATAAYAAVLTVFVGNTIGSK